jgi:Protein of unknown function (DUF2934)
MSNHSPHLSAHVRHPHGSSSAPSSVDSIEVRSASDIDIAKRAYEKYEARGFVHGFDLQDWTNASRELRAETFGQVTSSPSLSPSQYAS